MSSRSCLLQTPSVSENDHAYKCQRRRRGAHPVGELKADSADAARCLSAFRLMLRLVLGHRRKEVVLSTTSCGDEQDSNRECDLVLTE